MVQVNYDSTNKEKMLGAILIGVATIVLILGFLCLLAGIPEISVIFLAIGTVVCIIGVRKRKFGANVDEYVYLINDGFTSIDELSKKTHKVEAEVIEDINQLIQRGIFLNIFYDRKTKSIHELVSKTGSGKFNEEPQAPRIEKCPGCGANVDTSKSKYCEFCGRKLI